MRHAKLALALAVLFALVAWACGGDSPSSSVTAPDASIQDASGDGPVAPGTDGSSPTDGGASDGSRESSAPVTSTSQLPDPNVTFFALSKAFKPNKRVFAHYMLCCGSFGVTVDDFANEVTLAQAMGIDGFALNAGGWSAANYKADAANMFAAAKTLGTDFKLFFSADLCCNLPAADIVDMMTTYAAHANYLREGTKAVLSAWAGGSHTAASVDFWQNQVIGAAKTAGVDVFFIPFFYPEPVSEVPAPALVQDNVAFWKDHVDGMFYFGASGLPFGDPSLVTANAAYAQALAAAGKKAMASYSAAYWGAVQGDRRYFEYQGGLGTETQWKALVAADPDWVEISTWNDLNESYMMPMDDFQKHRDWGMPLGFYKPHYGYAELVRYYIQWFKTGIVPTLTRDSIFYAYRTQPKNLVPTAQDGGVAFIGDVQDDIYLTIPLLAPAELRVTTGGQVVTVPLPAGMNQKAVPFNVGAQSFELWRGGAKINGIAGEPVVDKGARYDFWSTTGFVETTP